MVITTSLDWTASPRRIFGVATVMSTPSSAMAATATGLIWSAGSVPAERTSMRSPARWASSPAAICDRPALWTQTNRTLGLLATSSRLIYGCCGKDSRAQSQRDVHQAHQRRDFDQRAHDAGQGLTGRSAVGGDRHGDSEFEVVAGGGECQRGRAGISQPQHDTDRVSAGPHDREIGQ